MSFGTVASEFQTLHRHNIIATKNVSPVFQLAHTDQLKSISYATCSAKVDTDRDRIWQIPDILSTLIMADVDQSSKSEDTT